MTEKYIHHGVEVTVISALKGTHRQNCLCYMGCKFFKPEDPANHCHIATANYALCKACDIVTPVWECAKYEKQENA